MEPGTSKILLSLFLKIISPVLRLVKGKLEKDLYIYTILRNKKIVTKITPDFNSIYLETLYQLIKIQGKDKKIIDLFDIDEVRVAFKEEFYKVNNWAFKVNLDANLHTNPNLRELKHININLDSEIEDFKDEFKKVVNITRNPKEVEEKQTLDKIIEDVSELIDTKVLNEKFNTNVEINNQILFSQSVIQPLSEHISKRNSLMCSLLEKYNTSGWIAIDGSVSTGKTQLTVLLTQRINSNIYWINLREFSSLNFLIKIYTDLSAFVSVSIRKDLDAWLSGIFEKIESSSLIVLDDLPKLDFRSQAFARFIAFIKLCKEKKVFILSTSNFELPIQINEFVHIDYIYSFRLPFLFEEDVYDVLLSYGVSLEKANQYKTLIHSLSSGHPVIVKAICEYLVQIKWTLSEEELSVIFKGDYSSELNESTYDILTKTIPDELTRNLLYRLNVFIGSFTVEDVRLMGNCTPEISNLVERFNSTIGLWVQRRDSQRFEVSPLLKKLRTKDLSDNLERQLNLSLGLRILDKRKLNQFEAQQALNYFIAAKSYNNAGFVLILVLNEALKNPTPYFEWGLSLYWYKTKLPYEMDLALQLYIRTLQILVDNQEDSDRVFLVSDLENICLVASKKGINVAPAYLVLATHYSVINSQKALNYLMAGNDQYKALIQEYRYKDGLELLKNFESLIWTAIIKVDSIEGFNHWFKTISGLSRDEFNLFKGSENMHFGSVLIFKNIQEKEERKEKNVQDWLEVIEIFKHIQEQARVFNLELLYANAIRYIINIYSQKLHKIDDSLNYARKFLDSVSGHKIACFIVNDAIGRQLFYNHRVDDATPYVAAAVDIDVNEFYTEKLDTYLVISQILGVKDSRIALHYSLRAKEFAKENQFTSDILQAKVIGELAISHFLNNDIVQAIYELEQGYQILLDSYNINPEFHITILRYGHVLNYWHHLLSFGVPPEKTMLGEDYAIPQRGMFISNYEEGLVEEYYFEERRFNVSLLFLKSFELINDFDQSKKWAYNNISISDSIDFNYFSLMLDFSIPYLIIDKKYIDSIKLHIRILNDINTLTEDDYHHERISKNKLLKDIIEDRPKEGIKEYDESIIEFVLTPILLDYTMTHSNNLDNFKESMAELKNAVDVLIPIFKDKAFVNSLNNLIKIIENGENVIQNILRISKDYDGDFGSPLKLICYLFSSVYCDDIDAFKYHFAIVNRLTTNLKKMSIGTFNFIVIPFFEKFWFNRIENNNYSNMDFWYMRSKKYYESTESGNKVKCLFRIVSHHLDYKTSIVEDEWLNY